MGLSFTTWLTYHHFYRSTLQAHGQQLQAYCSIYVIWWINRSYGIHLDTILRYRHLCNGHRIAHTCRIGDILHYFFQCKPSRLAHQPLLSGCTWYTIVDDDVETASIYRCNDKVGQPMIRPDENHDMFIKWEPTQTESWQKQNTQSKAVPASGSLDTTSKIQGMW